MIRVTMLIDGDEGEQLIALLSKALSRHEQGILSIQFEAAPPMVKLAEAEEPLKALIKRLPRVPSAPKPPAKEPIRRCHRGDRTSEEVILKAIGAGRNGAEWQDLQQAMTRAGYAATTTNGAVSRLKAKGLIIRHEDGQWFLAAPAETRERA
jgi:hypothetical protein